MFHVYMLNPLSCASGIGAEILRSRLEQRARPRLAGRGDAPKWGLTLRVVGEVCWVNRFC